MYREILKRLVDIIITSLIILGFGPIIVALALLCSLTKTKVFFTQTRIGKNNHPFKLYKLKTMNDTTDEFGKLLPDAKRLTPFGKILRKTSLDELPQLINVLKGEMSLVGPRPLLPQYLPLYSAKQAKRHLVKPGITGWAQVNGRNTISWDEKFDLDVYYVENQSFLLDIRIILLTIWNVLNRKGISAEGTPTMHPFQGNQMNEELRK